MIAEQYNVAERANTKVARAETISQPPDQTWAVLGGLRFVLASIVFWTHFGGYVRLPAPLSHIADAGAFAAVLGFFVVSGYSIAASLQRSPHHFYDRRLSRIYPVYFACMALACVPFLLYGPLISAAGGVEAPKSVWPVIANFFFLGGIATPVMPTNPVVWSLAIEVVYYLFAPWLARLRSGWLLMVIALSVAAYWGHDWFGVVTFNILLFGSYGTLALAWAWLSGFLLRRHPGQTPLVAGVLFTGVLLLGRFDQYIGHFSHAVFVGSVLVVASARQFSVPRVVVKALDWLGDLSYPLYLCHVPLLLLLYGGGRDWAWPVGVGAVAAGSVLLLHGVDLPYRAYARRRSNRHDTLMSVKSICAPVPTSLQE